MTKIAVCLATIAASLGTSHAAFTYFKVGSATNGTSTVSSGLYSGSWNLVQIPNGLGTAHNSLSVTADGFTIATSGGYNRDDTGALDFGGNSNLNGVASGVIWGTPSLTGVPATITITGLGSESTFNLVLFTGLNNANLFYRIHVTANGAGGTDTFSNDLGSLGQYASGVPYLTSASTGIGGNSITVSLANPTGAGFSNGVFWGLGIETVAVPEPGCLTWAGVAGLGLLTRRRRC